MISEIWVSLEGNILSQILRSRMWLAKRKCLSLLRDCCMQRCYLSLGS